MCALNIEDVVAENKGWNSGVERGLERGNALIQVVTDFLDRTIPLDGASHAEVENYTVEIPMRYAACFAILTDGRKVKFRDSRKFVGWSGWERKRSYLFQNNGLHIEIRTDPDRLFDRAIPGNVCNIILGSPVSEDQASECYLSAFRQNGKTKTPRLNENSKFIAPDGSQIVLTSGCLMLRELS